MASLQNLLSPVLLLRVGRKRLLALRPLLRRSLSQLRLRMVGVRGRDILRLRRVVLLRRLHMRRLSVWEPLHILRRLSGKHHFSLRQTPVWRYYPIMNERFL